MATSWGGVSGRPAMATGRARGHRGGTRRGPDADVEEWPGDQPGAGLLRAAGGVRDRASRLIAALPTNAW